MFNNKKREIPFVIKKINNNPKAEFYNKYKKNKSINNSMNINSDTIPKHKKLIIINGK